MSNLPSGACTKVRRSAASKAQMLAGSRKTRLFFRRATTRRGPCDRRAALEETLEALLDALVGEGLEEVVDDAEAERLQAVLRGRGREHEHRRRRLSRHRADQIEARARIARGSELDVDEDDVHGRSRHRLTRFAEAGHRPDHFRAMAALDQADEVVPGRPLVLEHQRLEEMRLAHTNVLPCSSGSSTMDCVPSAEDSSRSVAAPEYRSASRRRTDSRPNAPDLVGLSCMPGPLSSMVQTSLGPTSSARTVISPPPARMSAPCLTAFSTSGCKRSRGSTARGAPSPISQRNASWPAWRVARICA